MHVAVSGSLKALLGWVMSSASGACKEQFSSLSAGKQITVLLCFISIRMLPVGHPDPRFSLLQTFSEEFAVYLVM